MHTMAVELLSVWVGDHSIEVCDRCADIGGMKTIYKCEPITTARYMTMCVICNALPPMDLVTCAECGRPGIHPYDQEHAEGWCVE